MPNLSTFKTINENGFAHLDNENDKLISGTQNGQLNAWDFKSGNKICTVQAAHSIRSLKVKWPYVTSCGVEGPEGMWGCSKIMTVKIFNMENETLVRGIHVSKLASDVGFISNVLVITESTSRGEHRFMNWTQLLDGKVNRKTQSKFPVPEDKNFYRAMPIIAVVGSAILITEGRKIVKRSFWP